MKKICLLLLLLITITFVGCKAKDKKYIIDRKIGRANVVDNVIDPDAEINEYLFEGELDSIKDVVARKLEIENYTLELIQDPDGYYKYICVSSEEGGLIYSRELKEYLECSKRGSHPFYRIDDSFIKIYACPGCAYYIDADGDYYNAYTQTKLPDSWRNQLFGDKWAWKNLG